MLINVVCEEKNYIFIINRILVDVPFCKFGEICKRFSKELGIVFSKINVRS